MSATTTQPTRIDGAVSATRPNGAFRVLSGLAAFAVLLQGLWAGIFLEHDGRRDAAATWIDVHARCGEVALLFAAGAALVALVKIRHRHDLAYGSVVLVALLGVEAFLGGLIRDNSKDALTAVHVPLSLAIMAIAVWLPVRARHAVRWSTAGAE